MKIILLRDIAKIGKKFDVVEVADGYAFNYLIPRGMAEMATKAKEKEIEGRKAEEEAKHQAYVEKISKDVKALKRKPLKIKAKANEKGVLFAGLEKEDLLKALKEEAGVELSANEIVLEEPIKNTGEHKVPIAVGEEGLSLIFSVESK